MRWGLAFIIPLVVAIAALATDPISSPPPVSGRAASGTPLAEAFSVDSLFPKKAPVPAAPAAKNEEIPEDGLLPVPTLPPSKYWSGTADLGVNGAVGNSQLFNLRGGWNVRRKSDTNSFTSDFQYVYSEQSQSVKTNQALLNARDEHVIQGSNWAPFAAFQLEYDELRVYRFRVGTYFGTSYQVVDNETIMLRLRGGVGATRELGTEGQPNRWVAEFVLGHDFRYKFNDRSTFVSIFDLYPRIESPWMFRARWRAAYEYIIHPELGAVVRFGIMDRYDSDPGPAQKNDLTYFTSLGIKF